MRIGITGVTGLIGNALAALCQARGHVVVGFTRKLPGSLPHCQEIREFSLAKPVDLQDLDALIHLAGEPVIGLWTGKKRERILSSRIDTTRHLLQSVARSAKKPATFLCASGTGFYGDRGDEKLTESASAGRGFLAEVAQLWEKEAAAAQMLDVRVCQLRTGMVLAKSGGAFPLLRRVFTLGLGGKLGSGRQYLPWIHLQDIAALYLHCLEHPEISGPVNATAPQLLTNLEFTQTLAAAVHRPAIFGVPAFALKAALGDLSSVILESQRAIPEKALATGFPFAFPELTTAFADLTTP